MTKIRVQTTNMDNLLTNYPCAINSCKNNIDNYPITLEESPELYGKHYYNYINLPRQNLRDLIEEHNIKNLNYELNINNYILPLCETCTLFPQNTKGVAINLSANQALLFKASIKSQSNTLPAINNKKTSLPILQCSIYECNNNPHFAYSKEIAYGSISIQSSYSLIENRTIKYFASDNINNPIIPLCSACSLNIIDNDALGITIDEEICKLNPLNPYELETISKGAKNKLLKFNSTQLQKIFDDLTLLPYQESLVGEIAVNRVNIYQEDN